jgi:hypothetical protein
MSKSSSSKTASSVAKTASSVAKTASSVAKTASVVLKNTTPEFNKSVAKDLGDSIGKVSVMKSSEIQSDLAVGDLISKSYSPSVNELLTNLQSLSPNPAAFACENNQQIRINKGSKMECVDWESEAAQAAMLRNLKRKHIDFGKVIAPAQIEENCWFNCYFMCFFISDKGRKFFRYLRQEMITGKYPSNKEHKKVATLRWPLFLLNYYIESSLLGRDDPENFAEQMNTNTLIREIGDILSRVNKNVIMPGKLGNPLNYYNMLTNYLTQTTIYLIPASPKLLKKKKMEKVIMKDLAQRGRVAQILAVVIAAGKNKGDFESTKTYMVGGKTYKYSLDSAMIFSSDRKQWCALITGDGKGYASDGSSFSRLTPYEWKSKINSDEEFSFEGSTKRYNFKTCETYLLYYRS